MKKWILCATLAIASATTALAQTGTFTPPTPAQQAARQVARLTKLLDLDTGQQASATTIFTAEFTTLAGLRDARKTAQTALKTAIESNAVPGGIEAAAATLSDLEKQQIIAQGTADAAFYALLNSSQQTKYKALHAGGFGGPGPGGFGRGPGGPR